MSPKSFQFQFDERGEKPKLKWVRVAFSLAKEVSLLKKAHLLILNFDIKLIKHFDKRIGSKYFVVQIIFFVQSLRVFDFISKMLMSASVKNFFNHLASFFF